MKRAIALILLICATTSGRVLAQAERGKPPEKTEKKEAAGKIADGFDRVKWGASLAAVKNEVIGKLSYTDEKKVLISRDGDIEYLYGFFYREAASADAGGTPEAKLFYVSVGFPYLAKDDVAKKLTERYGPATGETIKANKGALVWDSEKTTVIMWVDEYEKKPFCRKITYVGKETAREVNEYQKLIFNAAEIEILKRLNP